MVHGTVPFVWMTMTPGSGAGVVPGRLSLVPLRDLLTMGPLGIAGNLLVFAALGFFAPVRWAAVASVPRILALGAGCSVLVESAQYVLRLDRVSSVDDVLVNAAGAALAGLASRRWWRTPPRARSERPRPAPAPTGRPAPPAATGPTPAGTRRPPPAYVGDTARRLGFGHARTDRGGRAVPGRGRPGRSAAGGDRRRHRR
ncbi:VanZ family protein [Streptomyces sp. NPDC058611]|uniref:VanZ family protein n=1 Tax=unclassified Streptomyces TaxID=2593676 RepID=UPI00364D9611